MWRPVRAATRRVLSDSGFFACPISIAQSSFGPQNGNEKRQRETEIEAATEKAESRIFLSMIALPLHETSNRKGCGARLKAPD